MDPLAQERVIRLACASASVTPADLAAVELHGTGTPLGDPVEVANELYESGFRTGLEPV